MIFIISFEVLIFYDYYEYLMTELFNNNRCDFITFFILVNSAGFEHFPISGQDFEKFYSLFWSVHTRKALETVKATKDKVEQTDFIVFSDIIAN